jgi:exodeoxyribonuclease V alpha subunit
MVVDASLALGYNSGRRSISNMCAFRPANPLIRETAEDAPLDQLEGTIERITFHNEENGYTVARLLPEGGRDVITILGNFSNPVVGESLICHGTWTRHAQWGRQMQVARYEVVRPATAFAIEKYLGSGMVKGIGPVMAKRIVEKFGEEALDVIEEHPKKLLEVHGIGKKKLDQIKKAWHDQREIRTIMLFLQSHGVSPAYAVKIYKTYGDKSIHVVEQNPYQLAQDIFGIGFKTADKIAREMGIAENDPRRIEAGVVYVLNESVESGGNAYLTADELDAKACEILAVESVSSAVDTLAAGGRLVIEPATFMGQTEVAIYPPSLHKTEIGLADRLKRMLAQPLKQPPNPAKFDAWLSALLDKHGFPLSDEQRDGVRTALLSRFMVLTGGPGTGKTTSTKAIVTAFEELKKEVLIASPTGRAAKRASEVTGREAKTVHRLLEFDPEQRGFKRGPDSPLECDVLIVDECSMLDMVLSYSLLKAVPNEAQVVFVGDVDQLPSVGPGNVLRDLIDSGVVPVARLTQVFRQAAQSLIITNAHAINQGRFPSLPPASEGKDCAFVKAEEPEEVAEKIVAIVARSLPKRGYKPNDIQVLTPMQRGSAGAAHLNTRLQETLNPPLPEKAEVVRGSRLFRVGDRVMQIVNNYDKGVYNGDIGAVMSVNHEDSVLGVQFTDAQGTTDVSYEFSDIDELTLAFATSIHKSQGSEYPVVVLAVHTQHYMLLQRNLLYTALTRAKKFAVLVGSQRAIGMAVKKQSDTKRHTRLKERLQGTLE